MQYLKWRIVWSAIILNTILWIAFRGDSIFLWLFTDIETQWRHGDYAEIAQKQWLVGEARVFKISALLKIWDIDGAFDELKRAPLDTYPERLQQIAKALLLREKWDTAGVMSAVSSSVSDGGTGKVIVFDGYGDDKTVQATFASLYAASVCTQRRRAACVEMAELSSRLDPFAAYPLLVHWWALRAQGQYTPAMEMYERAKMLGWAETPFVWLSRGIVEFYKWKRKEAISDLQRVETHPVYGYDAKIYLGRIYTQQWKYDLAREHFAAAKAETGTKAYQHDLWLGRVAVAQKDWSGALAAYKEAATNFPKAVEVAADRILLEKKLGRVVVFEQLVDTARILAWRSPYNYATVAGKLREAGAYLLAEEVASEGMIYASGDVQIKALAIQQYRTLLSQAYAMLKEWRDPRPLLSEAESLWWQLDQNPDVITLARALTLLRVYNRTVEAQELFRSMAVTALPRQQRLVRIRYALLNDNPNKAESLLSRLEDIQEGDTQVAWINRAIAMERWEIGTAHTYLEQLRQRWDLRVDDVKLLTTKELRQECMRWFSPWLSWMSPYIDSQFVDK